MKKKLKKIRKKLLKEIGAANCAEKRSMAIQNYHQFETACSVRKRS